VIFLIFIGSIVNAIGVIIGGLIGFFLHKNLPSNIKNIVFNGLGMATLFLGISMALKNTNFLILIFSILLGGIAGELLKIDRFLNSLGNKLKKFSGSKNDNFTEGLIAAFLLFCMGSMTIIGSINAGINGNNELLFAKSLMDFFASIALASTYGIGVIFSFIPLLLFQGSLTYFAFFFQDSFSNLIINNLTAVGGIIIMGLGFNLLKLKKIKVANFLPSLVIVIILTLIFL